MFGNNVILQTFSRPVFIKYYTLPLDSPLSSIIEFCFENLSSCSKTVSPCSEIMSSFLDEIKQNHRENSKTTKTKPYLQMTWGDEQSGPSVSLDQHFGFDANNGAKESKTQAERPRLSRSDTVRFTVFSGWSDATFEVSWKIIVDFNGCPACVIAIMVVMTLSIRVSRKSMKSLWTY